MDVVYEELRRGDKVYVCLELNESSVAVPRWMFDSAACAGMKVGSPQVSVAALEEVRVILAELGFDGSAAAINPRLKESAHATLEDVKDTRAVAAVAARFERRTSRESRRKEPQDGRRSPSATATRGGGGNRKGAER